LQTEPFAKFSREGIIQLCHSGLDSQSLRHEILRRLKSVVPFDFAYFSATDPSTLLFTNSVVPEPPPAWIMDRFMENEFFEEDFLKFRWMLGNRQSVKTLNEATGHLLPNSARYREMLAPLAMDDELRAIFVIDSSCWGVLCLHRAGQAYSAAEVTFVSSISAHVADGLRKALLLDRAGLASPHGPGVLILAEDQSIMGMTGDAEYWLGELADFNIPGKKYLPHPVQSVCAALQAIERGMLTNFTPKIRLRMRSGQWLILSASRLMNAGEKGPIAVILEIAQPSEIMPLIMSAYRLTKREGQIAQSVLLGWSTVEISTKLHISSDTVQDHLKSIFSKVNVNSRGKLAGRIFNRQYS
jgi:DNA-binding CsgD family transcriptional regulator